MFDLIEKLVIIETPTSDKPANDHISSIAAQLLRDLGGEVVIHPQEKFGDHITADWPTNDESNTKKHVLIVGHLDTVWPFGTLERMGYESQQLSSVCAPCERTDSGRIDP
jgi:glutamate carboxypeptidase